MSSFKRTKKKKSIISCTGVFSLRAHLSLSVPRWLGWSRIRLQRGKPGDLGSTPGLGRSPGGGHGNPLQYSCLENPRRARQATVQEVPKSQT